MVMAFMISTTVPSLVLSADVAVRRLSEDHKNLLIAELDHRLKKSARLCCRGRETFSEVQQVGGRIS
jgi:hypothetical protein